MLTRLLRERLRPYAAQVAAVVTLLAVQTVGNLFLPNLNADIINNGVVKGNVGYIFRTGALMLGVTLVLGVVAIVAVYWASRVWPSRRARRCRRCWRWRYRSWRS
jgi:ABC-type multidrug transport system fused ATPase/permease subunit